MDAEEAADEYALDNYEAESPPRASQQLRSDVFAESPTAASDDNEDEDEDDASPRMITRGEEADEEAQDAPESPADSVGKRRKRPLVVRPDKPPGATALRVASLTRKLAQAKKRNAEMHNQLQRLYQNDAIAFLENKAQERLRQIEALQVENRTLLYQQRALNKQIEELQDTVESMPTKRIAQREELRVCREQLRHYKETQKAAEEKSARLHQQVVDLTATNKALAEKVRQLESELSSVSSSSAQVSSSRSNSSLGQQEAEAVIASQEDEITRLQHRVDVLKKANKLDQSKHEKQASAAHQELDKARSDLEAFHQRVFEKEKVVRSQFLELKQLKRSLKDALSHIHTNQDLFDSVGGRQVRFTNHFHPQPTAKTLATSGSSAHEMLSKLGLLQLTSSASHASSVRVGAATSPRIQDANQIIRHVPCPPSGLIGEKKTPRSARSQVLPTASMTPVSRTSGGKHFAVDHSDETPPRPFYEDVDSLTFAPLVPTNAVATQPSHSEPS